MHPEIHASIIGMTDGEGQLWQLAIKAQAAVPGAKVGLGQ